MTRLGGGLGSPFSPRASWRKSCRLPRTGCHRHTPSLGAYLNSRPAGLHSRFGRDCRNPAITMIFDAPSTLTAKFPTQRNREFPHTYQGKFVKEQGISICGSLVSSRHFGQESFWSDGGTHERSSTGSEPNDRDPATMRAVVPYHLD